MEAVNDDDPLQETAYTYIAKYAVTDQHELLQLEREGGGWGLLAAGRGRGCGW